MAVSIDGKIATHPGENDTSRMAKGFGCKADHDLVKAEIEQADAIITGANSVRASNVIWDVKGRSGDFPAWFIFTNRGLAADLKFWSQHHIEKYIISSQPLPQPINRKEIHYRQYGTQSPAKFAYELLKTLELERILLFGGGWINNLFYAENLVDELKITISPIIVGSQSAPCFVNPELRYPVRLELQSSQAMDNHLFLNYRVLKSQS